LTVSRREHLVRFVDCVRTRVTVSTKRRQLQTIARVL
jgi:hypothetical protein